MKKILIASLMVVALCGCSMINPLVLPTQTSIMVEPDQYQVLSNIRVRGSARCTLLFIGLPIIFGDSGYAQAYANALIQCPGANALMNVTADRNFTTILGIYNSWTTIITGVPIKIIKDKTNVSGWQVAPR